MLHNVLLRKEMPRPRRGVYELYWAFASKRQAIYERRLEGAVSPWTDDPILSVYKFCNVFRAADRVSQYMISDVACASEPQGYADRLFQIVAFRTFSNIDTWNGVRRYLKRQPQVGDLASGEFERALDHVKAKNGGLYTGAFILCANKAFGFDEKHRNHAALFQHMFIEKRFDRMVADANSLEQVVQVLQGFPLIGPFMAYQTAIDINYSSLVDFSENDYTQAGPGALRGIKKAFEDLGEYTPSDTILWMTDRQADEFQRLGLPFNGLFGRPLHAIDCQGLFCELDKYCREAVPELRSNRSRIKARFSPSTFSLSVTFPAKWNLHPAAPVIANSSMSDAITRRMGGQYELAI